MNSLILYRLWWRSLRYFDRLGMLGRFSMLMSLIALPVLISNIIGDTPVVRDHAIAIKQNVLPTAVATDIGKAQLQSYWQQFPVYRTSQQVLQDVMDIAYANAIVPGSMDYQHERVADAPLEKITLYCVVDSDYSHLRGFLQRLLVKHPEAQLAQLTIHNQGRGAIQTELRINIYFLTEKQM